MSLVSFYNASSTVRTPVDCINTGTPHLHVDALDAEP
jgi:hypothetical protein